MLKRLVLVLAVVSLVFVGLAGIWFWGQATTPAVAQAPEATSDYNPARTITVVGQGSARMEPDIARVSIGVEAMAETVADAVEENKDKMTSVLTALEETGIAEKDIQTMHYSIQFERYPEPMPRVAGSESGEPKPQYRVSNMVNVSIRDLDKVGAVLDAVVEAGANNIWGVSFGLEDPKAAQTEARSQAAADALSRAEALAELNGVRLGPVMSVSEVVGSVPVTMPMGGFERAASSAGPISPGEVEVGYQLQTTYFIEP